MAKRKKHEKAATPLETAIADVPATISFRHGDELIDEYEDSVDIEFNNNTADGKAMIYRMHELRLQGFSTEDALFKIASDMVHTQATELLHTHANRELIKRAGVHEIHLHVKRNREITYKAPRKD
jgi:hypothetical protein